MKSFEEEKKIEEQNVEIFTLNEKIKKLNQNVIQLKSEVENEKKNNGNYEQLEGMLKLKDSELKKLTANENEFENKFKSLQKEIEKKNKFIEELTSKLKEMEKKENAANDKISEFQLRLKTQETQISNLMENKPATLLLKKSTSSRPLVKKETPASVFEAPAVKKRSPENSTLSGLRAKKSRESDTPTSGNTSTEKVSPSRLTPDSSPTINSSQKPNDEGVVQRPKKRNPENWKKNQSKAKKKYIKPVPNICKSSKHRFQCKTIVEEQRKDIFKKFSNYNFREKKQFLLDMICEVECKHKKNSTLRNLTRLYYFKVGNENVSVCKEYFLSTLSVSDRVIRDAKNYQSSIGISRARKPRFAPFSGIPRHFLDIESRRH